ncbi:hypothetical protein [Okeania sp. SIO1I7]|uniref:hypothetical protein n=1 Tax=Okeania sp. SIO1I7 TaxID=2607772 RepID=UPI0025DCDEAF|nr:hypothetical protein [Okeania sp. SIO1I7]
MISQTEIKVEIYRPLEAGCWFRESLGKEDCLKLNSVGLTFTIANIYDEVLTGE